MEMAYCQKIGNAANAYTLYTVSENGNYIIVFQGSKKAVREVGEKYHYEIKYLSDIV